MIQLYLNQTQVAVGAQLGGYALWTPNRNEIPRQITVNTGWRTEGRGDATRGTVGTQHFAPGPQGFPPSVQLPFDVLIPLEGPVSYDGNILRIIWEVSVRVDIPWATDEQQALQFRVMPRLVTVQP